MSLTLYVNKSDSHCECSYGNVTYTDHVCPHCGGIWTHISSDYSGMRDIIQPLRPDLIPHFPWDDWWVSEEGKLAQQELQELDTSEDE